MRGHGMRHEGIVMERVAVRVGRARRETPTTAGMLAARAWLMARGLAPTSMTRWQVEIALDVVDEPARDEIDERHDTQLRIEIHSDEWGFRLCHEGFASSVRVTEVPVVQGRDEFGVLASTPALRDIGPWIRKLESRLGIRFQRSNALVRTNLPGAGPTILGWIETL